MTIVAHVTLLYVALHGYLNSGFNVVPSWARFLTGIMKPLMGNLLDKFEMFGYEDWLPALVTRFDAQELPKGYSKYVGDGDGDADGNEGWSSWF